MNKVKIQLEGQVAELMEENGRMHAKIVCTTNNLLLTIQHNGRLELGDMVHIKGKLEVTSLNLLHEEHDELKPE